MYVNYNFNQFRSGIQGNLQQMVDQLRQHGQMSDAQFQQLSNMIMPFMRR